MSDAAEKKKDAIIKYQRLREEVDDLFAKLGQMESDRNEHEYASEDNTTAEAAPKRKEGETSCM